MARGDNTKAAIAGSFMELMRHRAIDAISVKELCRISGIHRRTFYYHFEDKGELIKWIYAQAVKDGAQSRNPPAHWSDRTRIVYHHVKDNRVFYNRVYRSNFAVRFSGYTQERTLMHLTNEIQKKCAARNIPDSVAKNAAMFYTQALIAFTRDWRSRGAPGDPDRIVDWIVAFTEKGLDGLIL